MIFEMVFVIVFILYSGLFLNAVEGERNGRIIWRKLFMYSKNRKMIIKFRLEESFGVTNKVKFFREIKDDVEIIFLCSK